jgi:hypothetical protein
LKILAILLLIIGLEATAEESTDQPITAEQSATYQMRILTNGRYMDQQGREVVDIIEGDKVYFAVSLETDLSQPVIGAVPEFDIEGTTEILTDKSPSPLTSTDESGIFEFGLIAGKKGLDKLTVSYGNNTDALYLNIISLNIKTFSFLPKLEGGISWDDLMQAQLEYLEDRLVASFPTSIAQQAGEQVKLAGYMTPLDADTRQRHFLLTSAPPSCYFHIPGGAAGVVEVFSKDGIESSWTAITLQGKLKLIESSESGIIYQLQDAKVSES